MGLRQTWGMSESNPSLTDVLAKMKAQTLQRIKEAAALEGRTPLDYAKKTLLEETDEFRINALQDVVAILEKEQPS